MPSKLEIRNVILPDSEHTRYTIRIEGGRIAAVGVESGWKPQIDAGGLHVLPGVIDGHVHSRVPGEETKENWSHLAKAAWAGGVTTVCDMPNTRTPLLTVEALEVRSPRLPKSGLTVRFWFGATADNLGEIRQVAKDQRLVGIKLYMAPTTGNLAVTGSTVQRRIFELCSELGLLLAVHPEDWELMEENRRLLGRQPVMADHCLIRNTEVEVSAVRKALRFAKETGCRLHLCHISTPEAVEVAHTAKQRGVNVTVETCPHFLVLDCEKLSLRHQPGIFKTNPPLRTTAQMLKLRRYALGRNGFVDTVGSDHAPHEHFSKCFKDYDQVPSGVPGVQTILPLLLGISLKEEVSFTRLVELTSANPASRFGFSSKGRIEVGCDADLVLFDPQQQFRVRDRQMKSLCGWTPFTGMQAAGEPQVVIAGGNVVLNRLEEG